MTSPYLYLRRFSFAGTLKAGVNTWAATMPSVMPDHLDTSPPGDDYRQLARRLRELARETHRPYARQELVRLSAIYERRAEHLENGAGKSSRFSRLRTTAPGNLTPS
jgi:hypothetical protein